MKKQANSHLQTLTQPRRKCKATLHLLAINLLYFENHFITTILMEISDNNISGYHNLSEKEQTKFI